MKRKKTFFDRIEELKGKEGTIKLSDIDRKSFIEGAERSIEEESKKRENYIWLLIGLGVGILGNFIVNLFYDWIKNLGGWRFGLMSFLLVILFFIFCYILFMQLKEFNNDIGSIYKSKKMWAKTKSIIVGKPVEVYDNDEWKRLQK